MDMVSERGDVLVVGAGFGGLEVARNLRDTDLRVLLVDRHNYHTFQPLLYQVATAGLDAEHVAHTVRDIFHGQENLRFRMATVSDVDFENDRVELQDKPPLGYRHLVLALGASTNYFGVKGAREHGFPIKNLSNAIHLRSHVLSQFEQVDRRPELVEEGFLNFVVVGGGPTGIETAGTLAELFENVLRLDYGEEIVSQSRVLLLEMQSHLLDPYEPSLRDYAQQKLEQLGVDVRLETTVERVEPDRVVLSDQPPIPTRTLIWAAGVKANPVADVLDAEQTRGGRLTVNEDLRIPDRENVFVIGDLAGARDDSGDLLPQLAPVALQQGVHTAAQIKRRREGRPTEPFRYDDPGQMATIGRHAAVVELSGGLTMTGPLAWLIWVFLHIAKLIGFRNRLMVFVTWVYNYFTWGSSSRLILDVEREFDRLES